MTSQNKPSNIKTLIPMMVMLFCLGFIQCTLWNLKDALLITASGAEVIPFIKVWAILPATFLMSVVLMKLSKKLGLEKTFYCLIGAFFCFFALFGFALYPWRDFLHPTTSVDYLKSALPEGLSGLICMYRYWTYTLFYVASELWTTVMVSVLFWIMANQITPLKSAPKNYSALTFTFNAAVAISALSAFIYADSHYRIEFIPFGKTAWDQTVMLTMLLVMANCLIAFSACRFLYGKHSLATLSQDGLPPSKKAPFSFYDSIFLIFRSKYLVCIAIVVLGYNLSINMVEVVWKDLLKSAYPTPQEYNHYSSGVVAIHGFLALLLSLITAKAIHKLGWSKTALITPVLTLILALLVTVVLFFRGKTDSFHLIAFEINPLFVALFLSSIQICFSKACKYSLFDSTKEMSFIPLSDESRLSSKVAIDGIGARLGKSGSSLIHQGLLMAFASVASSAIYVSAILFVILIGWIVATVTLGKEMQKLSL